ncbi:MAG: hypothetical protein ACP5OZ_04685 [Candidatus Woesearchaeota archaeon]
MRLERSMKRFFGFLILVFMLVFTLVMDVFLYFWERRKGFKILPGS